MTDNGDPFTGAQPAVDRAGHDVFDMLLRQREETTQPLIIDGKFSKQERMARNAELVADEARNLSWHDELAAQHKLVPEKPVSKRWVAHMKSIQAERKGAAG